MTDMMMARPQAPAPMLPATGRVPASAAFLRSHLLRTSWGKDVVGVPVAWSQRWVLDACEAELAWATADWKRISPDFNGLDHEAWQLAELDRLPHERAAAKVLNCRRHLVTPESEARKHWQFIRAGRNEAVPAFNRYLAEVRRLRPVFAEFIAEYRAAREAVDAVASTASA